MILENRIYELCLLHIHIIDINIVELRTIIDIRKTTKNLLVMNFKNKKVIRQDKNVTNEQTQYDASL